MPSSNPDPSTERLGPEDLPQLEALVLAGLREHESLRRTERLPERYELKGPLGRGGMAVVHRARDRQLGRDVAVKFLRDDYLADAEAEARFRREAETTARLNHPGIVTVHDAGEGFLVMELVDGPTLAELLADRPPPLRERVALIEQVARAVDAAHAAGIVHRDLKPGNVMIAPGGAPKVADFGLAHLSGDVTAMTASGAVLGTPAYMAPEQAAGERDRIGPATDVYALGAMLYECLTGDPPYFADTPLEVLRQIASSDPIPPRRTGAIVPADLETITLVAMAREPGRRYASAAALADDLARWQNGLPIAARRPSLLYRLRRQLGRRKALAGVAALGLVAVAAAVALLLPRTLHARRVLALWGDVSVLLADAELHARAGQALAARQRLERGVARCRASLAEAESAEAHYFLGRLLALRGHDQQAFAALDRALALDPGLGEAQIERGLLRAQGYDKQLMRVYAQYAGRPPGSGRASGPSGEELERRHPELARLRDAAARDLSIEAGRSPYFRPADARFGRAEFDRLRWRWKEATAGYDAVLAAEPLHVRALLGLARMAYFRTDYAAAIEHAGRAIEQHRGAGAAHLLRGQARFWLAESAGRAARLELLEGASTDLDGALTLLEDPADLSEAHTARGHLRLKRDDRPGARADLDRALQLEPRNAIALNARAQLHFSMDRMPQARADLDAALRISPTYGQALFNRAQVRAGQDDERGAAEDARAALRWSPPGSRLQRQAQDLLRILAPR